MPVIHKLLYNVSITLNALIVNTKSLEDRLLLYFYRGLVDDVSYKDDR